MSLVEKICGVYPSNFEKVDIASDPNYVFLPDPNYQSRPVYDVEGNLAFVNSFIECEHYVSGGWTFDPSITLQLLEEKMQNYILIAILLFMLSSYFYKKYYRLSK